MHWHILKPFETVEAGPYRVTPLPANHMNPAHQPFVYHIVDTREDKSVFYMHDSGYYFPEVWDYLKAQKKPADLFSFDTTLGYEDCGFNDYTTFYRSYVKFFGHSPSTDRKNGCS